MKALRSILVTLALGLALSFPSEASAQLEFCGFCVQEEPGSAQVECSTTAGETSELLCEDVTFFGLICLGCDDDDGPGGGGSTLMAPDGSLIGAHSPRQTDRMQLLTFGEEIGEGVFASRSRCGTFLTSVFYSERAEARLRTEASSLTL